MAKIDLFKLRAKWAALTPEERKERGGHPGAALMMELVATVMAPEEAARADGTFGAYKRVLYARAQEDRQLERTARSAFLDARIGALKEPERSLAIIDRDDLDAKLAQRIERVETQDDAGEVDRRALWDSALYGEIVAFHARAAEWDHADRTVHIESGECAEGHSILTGLCDPPCELPDDPPAGGWEEVARCKVESGELTAAGLGDLPAVMYLACHGVRIWCAFLWPEALRDWRERNAETLGTAGALEWGREEKHPEAADRLALEQLRDATARKLPDVVRAVGWPWSRDDLESPGESIPDRVATELERLGGAGKKLADRVRAKSLDQMQQGSLAGHERPAWWAWWEHPERLARYVAIVQWCDVVRPALEEAKTPTLPLGVQQAHVRATFRSGRRIEDDGAVLGPAGVHVGRLAEVVAVAALPRGLFTRGLTASASLTTHRLFRWLPRRARDQVLRDRLDLTRAVPCIVIPGGIGVLAEEIGAGKSHARTVRNALDWLQHVLVVGEDNTEYHGLLTWSETRGHRSQPAEAEIIPSKALLLGGGRGKLTPVPHDLPRFAGSSNGWGAQASLQLLVMEELRRRARELVEQGGVKITRHDWVRLADQAGLVTAALESLIGDGGAWLEDGKDGRAFLQLVAGGRVTLADAYADELACLIEGGNWDRGSSEKGKASAAKRRKATLRKRGARGA